MFNGFTDETLRFFLDIRFHNDVSYFNENRSRYEAHVLTPFRALAEDVGNELVRIDPRMELRPYRMVARLRRDTRFSKDKSPFRDHLWITWRRAGEPREGSLCYWFVYGPEQFGWGLGTWGENRPMMDTFRRRAAAKPEEALRLIEGCRLPERGLILDGRAFSRLKVPDGLPLALRPWYLSRELDVSKPAPSLAMAEDPGLSRYILDDFLAMAPIYRMMRGILDEADLTGGAL